jgi:hypothetical protein
MGLTSYSTYYKCCVFERITKMKRRVEEQLPLAFAYVVAKLEILHQNPRLPNN